MDEKSLADEEFGWLPGWVQRPADEMRALAALAAAEPALVFDTAYGSFRDLVEPRAEVVIGLDYPRWISLGRLLKRTLIRVIDRRPICNGNVETFRQVFSLDSIVVWHFRSFSRKRATMRAWAGPSRRAAGHVGSASARTRKARQSAELIPVGAKIHVGAPPTRSAIPSQRGNSGRSPPRPILATLVAMTVEGSMALKDVKDHLSEVVDQVEREHDRVVITKHGRPAAVVVSVDDLASLEETLDIAGRPQLMRQIRASLTELAAGEAEILTKDEILRILTA